MKTETRAEKRFNKRNEVYVQLHNGKQFVPAKKKDLLSSVGLGFDEITTK